MFTFRRGSRPTCIHSLAFNHDSTKLAVSGSSDTVHVFELGTVGEKSDKNFRGSELYQPGKKVISHLANASKKTAGGLMPQRVSDLVNCDRSIAHAQLWRPGERREIEWLWGKNICCFVPREEVESKDYDGFCDCLVVMRYDGLFLRFVVEPTMAGNGNCRLILANSLIRT